MIRPAFSPSRVSPRARLRGTAAAFTLIELLVVITIIVILMALLFPAFRGVQNQAKKVQAKNDVNQIVAAVNAYYTEYGKYPMADVKQGFDTLYGDPNGSYGNEDVFNVLRAVAATVNAADVLNPRKVAFFTGNTAKSSTAPTAGFATVAVTGPNGSPIAVGAYVDPWGDTYMVSIDGNYDGSATDYLAYTDLSSSYTTIGGFSTIRVGCFSSSFGIDGKKGTNGDGKYIGSDDVLSWQ